jgi:hypothetical protein
MRVFTVIFVTSVVLMLSFIPTVWSQGRFVEGASVLVTANPGCIGASPWQRNGEPPAPVKLNRGWMALSAVSVAHLSSGEKIELFIYIYSDRRGRMTGKPAAKVEGKRIVINISEEFRGPGTPVYEPSLWSERVTVEKLEPGMYQVYLHGPPAGKIMID